MKRTSAPSFLLLALLPLLLTAGCRVRSIETTIVNHGPALQLLEFDYPSASFGVDALPPEGSYHYRFTAQGPGPLTLHFEDGAGHSYTSAGPTVREGEEGSLTITIDGRGKADWNLVLKGKR